MAVDLSICRLFNFLHMSALLRFFARFAHFFEFLFLEVIAFLLICNFNAVQQSAFYRFNSSVVAAIYSATSACTDYFSLGSENQRLIDENSALLNRIAELEAQRPDTLAATKAEGAYRTFSAKVVYCSVNRMQNVIVLDRGSADGVAVDMGVMNGDGVVGMVDAVSEHYAVVVPVISVKSMISSKIAKNGYIGSVVWDGLSPEYAELTDIPYHVDVEAGDTVVTSGYSAIFADGVPIGVVDHVEVNESQVFCKIRLRLLANFRTVSTVHVVDCAHREELKQVIKENF